MMQTAISQPSRSKRARAKSMASTPRLMSATAGSVRTGTRHETASDTRSASRPGRSSASASATSAGHPGAARRPNTSSSRSDTPTVRDVTPPVALPPMAGPAREEHAPECRHRRMLATSPPLHGRGPGSHQLMTVLARSSARSDDRAGTVCVGLVAAPELPVQIAVDLAERLPELLDRHRDGRWRVELAEEPLLAGREGVEEILDAGYQARRRKAGTRRSASPTCPLRDGALPLVPAVDRHDKVAVVNIPAFGASCCRAASPAGDSAARRTGPLPGRYGVRPTARSTGAPPPARTRVHKPAALRPPLLTTCEGPSTRDRPPRRSRVRESSNDALSPIIHATRARSRTAPNRALR